MFRRRSLLLGLVLAILIQGAWAEQSAAAGPMCGAGMCQGGMCGSMGCASMGCGGMGCLSGMNMHAVAAQQMAFANAMAQMQALQLQRMHMLRMQMYAQQNAGLRSSQPAQDRTAPRAANVSAGGQLPGAMPTAILRTQK